jgi:hypothetical protein
MKGLCHNEDNMKKYVVYYRVWQKKSPSRVELPAQEAEAARFVSYNNGRIIAAYKDREGKHTERLGFRQGHRTRHQV